MRRTPCGVWAVLYGLLLLSPACASKPEIYLDKGKLTGLHRVVLSVRAGDVEVKYRQSQQHYIPVSPLTATLHLLEYDIRGLMDQTLTDATKEGWVGMTDSGSNLPSAGLPPLNSTAIVPVAKLYNTSFASTPL